MAVQRAGIVNWNSFTLLPRVYVNRLRLLWPPPRVPFKRTASPPGGFALNAGSKLPAKLASSCGRRIYELLPHSIRSPPRPPAPAKLWVILRRSGCGGGSRSTAITGHRVTMPVG